MIILFIFTRIYIQSKGGFAINPTADSISFMIDRHNSSLLGLVIIYTLTGKPRAPFIALSISREQGSFD